MSQFEGAKDSRVVLHSTKYLEILVQGMAWLGGQLESFRINGPPFFLNDLTIPISSYKMSGYFGLKIKSIGSI